MAPMYFSARILGCVVAHELGHVLLGPRSHSAEGIMAADSRFRNWSCRG